MHAIGFISILLFVLVSFVLLCVIAFAGEEFSKRREWRVCDSKKSQGPNVVVNSGIDLGRLFLLALARAWVALLALSMLYIFGAKYVA